MGLRKKLFVYPVSMCLLNRSPPIHSSTKAKRPFWSVLDGEPLRQAMNWSPKHWKEALKECWLLKKKEEL